MMTENVKNPIQLQLSVAWEVYLAPKQEWWTSQMAIVQEWKKIFCDCKGNIRWFQKDMDDKLTEEATNTVPQLWKNFLYQTFNAHV